jgi:hypothetical protein
MFCAVILTAIPVEYEAVRCHLQNIQPIEISTTRDKYEEGTFEGEGVLWQVIIQEVGEAMELINGTPFELGMG